MPQGRGGTFNLFKLGLKRARTFTQRDGILAFYAPVTLLLMPIVWLFLIQVGYSFMYWALRVEDGVQAFVLSGSSLLTLGFAQPPNLPTTLLVFSEATLGLILVALLIAYLPTIYGAFSRREAAVTMMEVRAGTPPSAVEIAGALPSLPVPVPARDRRLLRHPHNPHPRPDDPISISRAEFEAALDELAAEGVPLKPDRDQAWRDFAGWRVNYDTILRALAGLVMAPPAMWSSDRARPPKGVSLRRYRNVWDE